MGVSMRPGRMQFARMPTTARSRASGSVSPTTPPLDDEYATWPIWPSSAATEAVFTMAPRQPSPSASWRLIFVAASRQTLNVPTRLISMTFLYRSRSCALAYSPSFPIVRVAHPIPAQFTTLHSGARAEAASTAAITWSVSVTSHDAKAPPSSLASASPFSALRSARSTRTPRLASRRAVDSPRPEAPPVMSAEVLVSSMGLLRRDQRKLVSTKVAGESGQRKRPSNYSDRVGSDRTLRSPGAYDPDGASLRDALVAEPAYRLRQVEDGLWRQHRRPAELTALPRRLRDELDAALPPALRRVAESVADGGRTTKWVFELHDGATIETVVMAYG